MPAGLIEFLAELFDWMAEEGIEGHSQREGLMFVKEIEREDLDLPIRARLEGDGGGAIEGHFADHRAGVIGDSAHDIEASGGTADTNGAGGRKVRREFRAVRWSNLPTGGSDQRSGLGCWGWGV